jgi:D-alanyl-D-alanine carboxypeptidase
MVSQDVLSLYNRGKLREGVQQAKAQLQGAGAKQWQHQQLAASRTKLHVKGMRCEGW